MISSFTSWSIPRHDARHHRSWRHIQSRYQWTSSRAQRGSSDTGPSWCIPGLKTLALKSEPSDVHESQLKKENIGPRFPCKDRTEMVNDPLSIDSHTSYNTHRGRMQCCTGMPILCQSDIFCLPRRSLDENQNKKNAVSHATMPTAEWPLSQSSMFRAW